MPTSHPRPWHRGSTFGAGPRRMLDREQLARYKFLVRQHRQARRITPAYADVAEALVRRIGVDGRCDPSIATLADDALVSVRTAGRALVALRGVGLIGWGRRIIRVAATGWQVRQVSSAYWVTPGNAGDFVAPVSKGQSVRQTRSIEIFSVPTASPTEIAAARRALAARRSVVEARLLGKGVA